jgi:hypothetical protein
MEQFVRTGLSIGIFATSKAKWDFVCCSMARSYRRTFIETAGDLKNTFAHKVFCSWDFSTATSEAAALRSKSIYNELKVRIQTFLFSSHLSACPYSSSLVTAFLQ